MSEYRGRKLTSKLQQPEYAGKLRKESMGYPGRFDCIGMFNMQKKEKLKNQLLSNSCP